MIRYAPLIVVGVVLAAVAGLMVWALLAEAADERQIQQWLHHPPVISHKQVTLQAAGQVDPGNPAR